MDIRTTTLGTSTSMLNYITSGESKYFKLSEEASSGLKLTLPSEDPTATRTVLNINTRLSQLSSYANNMSLAQNELDVSDNTLTSISTAIQNANDLATQAANGTYSQKDLDNIRTQINQIMSNVTDLANTQYNGNYIFSGTSTTTPAYKVVTDASGNITSATYQGTPSTGDYQRNVQIADGVSLPVNTTGDQVLGSYTASSAGPPAVAATGSGLLYTLGTLSEALGKGNVSTTVPSITSSIDSLTANLDTVLSAQTQFASVSKRFEMTTNSNTSMTTQLKSSRSDLQDADLSQVLTDLTAQKNALQATMSVTSQLLTGTSLLDYIK